MATYERFVSLAAARGHPEPERLANSSLKFKASAQKLKDARPKSVVISPSEAPPMTGLQGPVKKVAAKVLCQARTLEGRPCGFAATCGPFCKRHLPATPVVTKPFKKVDDPSRFEGLKTQGTFAAAAPRVCEVLGKPNGPKTEGTIAAWQIELKGGALARVAFLKGSRELHVSGAVEEVRKLLL
jgi:hypothetical protein